MNSLKFYSVQGTELVDHSVFISHFEWIKEFNNALSNTEDFFFFELAWNYNQLHFYVNKLKLKSGVGQCSKRTKVSLEVCCISWEHLENSKTVFIIWFITGKFCKIQLKSNIEKKTTIFLPFCRKWPRSFDPSNFLLFSHVCDDFQVIFVQNVKRS
jgi:hypothetical protein